MNQQLLWFRSDLRVADNPALAAAIARSDSGLTGLFITTPDQWIEHHWGAPKKDFIQRSVNALAKSLANLGIPFRIEHCPSFSSVPSVVERVARETGSRRVLANRELEINERRRDTAVARVLKENDIEWVEFDDQTIVPPGKVLTQSGTAYTVFSPFFRSWVRYLEETGLGSPSSPPIARFQNPQMRPSTLDLDDTAPAGLRSLWPAGEAEAQRRLRLFLSGLINRYHKNRDWPSIRGTSSFSPYLAVGAISARTLLWTALEVNRGELTGGQPGIAAWIRQLAWRDFYRHILVAYPRVSMNRAFQRETDRLPWRHDSTDFEAWKNGQTGFPIIDAAMRALLQTGWLHNRLRMIVASFLTKDLFIDWRLGEQHFMNYLVDGDLANNNGGWQWAASTGTDASPYFRIFNPWRQSKRYDPEGQFIRRYVKELAAIPASALHHPHRLARLDTGNYPSPIVDHSQARARTLAAFRSLKI